MSSAPVCPIQSLAAGLGSWIDGRGVPEPAHERPHDPAQQALHDYELCPCYLQVPEPVVDQFTCKALPDDDMTIRDLYHTRGTMSFIMKNLLI
eukprot:1217443-Prymnesium_polylepis.1